MSTGEARAAKPKGFVKNFLGIFKSTPREGENQERRYDLRALSLQMVAVAKVD